MNCKDIDKLLTAYLDNEVTPEEQAQIQAHLATCADCQRQLRALADAQDQLCQSLRISAAKINPSPDTWTKIRQKAGIARTANKTAPGRLATVLQSALLSVFLIILLVAALIPALGGMAQPPPSPPTVVADGNGGAYITWVEEPRNYSHGIYAQHIDAFGNLLWGETGKLVTSINTGIPRAISDNAGGIIIAWGDGNNIYARRLDAEGNDIWDATDIFIATDPDIDRQYLTGLVTGEAGGAILLIGTSENGVYAQKVGVDGTLPWGENGVFLGNVENTYSGQPFISDGDGGAVVAWGVDYTDTDVYAQRINKAGELLWTENGIQVTNTANTKRDFQLVGDGNGNYIIAWTVESYAPEWNEDIYAQKLSADGTLLWADTGLPVCDETSVQSAPQLAADGDGGCIVIWSDRRELLNGGIFAQRLNAAGERMWAEDGVKLWDVSGNAPILSGAHDYHLITGGDGQSIIVWAGRYNPIGGGDNFQLSAQKLGADGQRLWLDTGLAVYEKPPFRSIGYSSIASDGQGGVIIGSRTSQGTSLSNTDSVYIQRIDSTGNLVWGESGLDIQIVGSSIILQLIALATIIITALILIGTARDNKLTRISTVIAPILLGITALFSQILMIGFLGYSYRWAYILHTPLNATTVLVISITGFIVALAGIIKRTASRCIMIPLAVFCLLIAALGILPLLNYI